MKKRLISLFLGVIFIAANLTLAAYAEDTQLSEEKTRAYDLLAVLSIYEPEEISPDKEITRGELVNVLGKMLNIEVSENYEISQNFDDVEDAEIAAMLDNLSEMGILSGTGDRIYEPETAVTGEQLATCLVTLLGYERYAQYSGGYPYGYLQSANQLDLFKYSSAGMGRTVTESDFAVVLANALETYIATFTAEGTGFVIEESDETILSKYHDIFKAEGTVTDDGITSLTGESEVAFTQTKIGDITLEKGDARPGDFLGQYVSFFYHRDIDDAGTLVWLESENNRQETLVVNAECIVDAQRHSVEYFPNNDVDASRTKALDISPIAIVIYNGKSYLDYTADDLLINSGNITFIDEDGDDEYDIVYIKEYTSILFASYAVTSDETLIRDQYSSERDIEFDNDTTILSIEREGEQVGLDALVEWDVLNVLLPKNYSEQERNSIEIYVTVEPVGGEIESVNGDELVVSGIEYTIAESYLEAVELGYAPALESGKAGRFLLDINGNVAGFREISRYDYIYATRIKIDDTTEPYTGILRGYVWNEGFVELKLSKRVTINGIKDTVPEVFVRAYNIDGSLFSSVNNDTLSYTIVPQLVRVRTNINDEIISIDTASDLTGADLVTRMQAESAGTFRKSTEDEDIYYRGAGSFEGKVYPTSSTRVIVVPKEDATLEDVFASQGGSSFSYDASYDIITYNESIYNVPEYIIVQRSGASGSSGDDDNLQKSSFYIHNRFDMVLDEDDMVETVLSGLQDGADVEKSIVDNFVPSTDSGAITPEDLEFGTIVQMGEDAEGNVNYIKEWYSPSQGYYKSQTSDDYRQNWRSIISGEVRSVSSDGNYIIVDDGNIYTYDLGSAVVTICDMGIYKELRAGETTEIRVGDQVTMRIRETRVHEIVVYKNLER